MSKNPKPTVEELRCVYDLILRGYDDADILAEYASLYENGNLMFPYRTDKRFVRERRRELIAAQEVLKKHLKKVDPITAQNKKEHFEHLAEIAELLLDGGLDKISNIQIAGQYEIIEEGYTTKTLTQDQLTGILEGNIDVACQKYGQWQVFDCLMKHVEAEYPACQDLYGFINAQPLEFINIIRTLAARKTFKGTCPVCKELQ